MGPELHTPFGIVRDRTWMVVNAEYHFLTQRRIPRMALICPEIDGAFLLVTAPDMAPLRVPIQPDLSTAKVVQSAVWSQEISGIDCGDEAGEWFSKFLEEPGLRLIYHPPEFAGRQLVERDAKVLKIKRKMWEDKDKCAFADAAPYQLLSEDSVAELSRHMDTPVPYLHFRPSILVNGCPPNNEDHWWRFRIGTSEFRATKQRCRCTLTTVDPQTGTFGRKDVLETLKKFRSNQSAEWDEVYKFGPLLAVDLGIDKTGTCSVGDIIVHLPDE
ncbi:mitochondrial amidoxime-reducing component 1-like [Paramacrobiotus metropolitanus]|uniref:mitochondrial amidoxime-reducing component 1-like n=1 Tax=Paramacrobiotus metropolitanus TaxID=2943436 RepID=UPI002445E27D|nr:mitochondrial amidoxime-reducing component 1-like [Paramacrobiotus metropolitanus]